MVAVNSTCGCMHKRFNLFLNSHEQHMYSGFWWVSYLLVDVFCILHAFHVVYGTMSHHIFYPFLLWAIENWISFYRELNSYLLSNPSAVDSVFCQSCSCSVNWTKCTTNSQRVTVNITFWAILFCVWKCQCHSDTFVYVYIIISQVRIKLSESITFILLCDFVPYSLAVRAKNHRPTHL